jgi:hypothetical protein
MLSFSQSFRTHLNQKTSIPVTKLSRGNAFPRIYLHENADGVEFGPRTPAPGPILFRLRLAWLYPVLEHSNLRNEKGGIWSPSNLPPT